MSRQLIFFLCLMLFGHLPLQAGDCEGLPLADCHAQPIEVRQPSGQLDQYRNDPAFTYERKVPEPEQTFIGRAIQSVYDQIQKALKALWRAMRKAMRPIGDFFGTSAEQMLNFLVYTAIIISVLAILYLLLKNTFGIATTDGYKSSGISYLITEEEIRTTDFEALMNEALGDQQYRLAVRYLYLKSLQRLVNRRIIDWKSEKTNRDYLLELPMGELRQGFGRLTLLFEYVWYGEFNVDRDRFEQFRNQFQQFEKSF